MKITQEQAERLFQEIEQFIFSPTGAIRQLAEESGEKYADIQNKLLDIVVDTQAIAYKHIDIKVVR